MSKFTDEQLAAIAAKGRTIVSASAGSGKTTVMIEKMIRLILDEGVDVTRILAVTYTKKAAASMKDKLRKELVKAINRPGVSVEERTRLKAQYRQVPLADISTVHSFCAKLIRTHFYATDVDNKFGIISDEDADGTSLKNRAIENVFEEAYAEQEEDFLRLLSVYYRKKKDDTLREIIVGTHSKVRTHVGYREELMASGKGDEATFDAVCRDAYGWFAEKTRFYREKVLELCRLFAADSSTLAPAFVKHCEALLDNLNAWLDAGDLFTLAQLPWKKMPPKPKLGTEQLSPEFEGWVQELDALQTKIKTNLDAKERKAVKAREVELKNFQLAAETARALAKYVLLFDAEYTRLKRRRGVLDYNDLEHITLELLEREEIAAEMREKYDYVFVDEYQDVNPVQERIINGVSGENLFLVGDIKQSIYGFRGSKSVFFAEKWQEFLENPADNALKLSKNFRSATPVLDAVNVQFCKIMTKSNSEVDYEADGVMEFGGLYPQGKGSVQLHFVGKEKEEKAEFEPSVYSVRENAGLRQVQISAMARKIREIVELEIGREYYDIEKKENRRVQYSDIAVLDRWKKGSIVEIIAALTKEGVPVSSEAPLNVCEFPEIKTLIDLLKLIDNEEQDIPLASVLISAVGGLDEDDLVRIRLAYRDEKRLSFREACRRYAREKEDFTAQRLAEFFAYFKRIRSFAQVKDAGEVLTRVIAETQMEAHLLAGVNGESCLKRIHRFLEETRIPSPLDVHEFLERLKMLDYTVQYCENGGENAVHVMTMHASKGLEFPVVILSNMSRSFRIGDTDEGMYVEGYGLAPKAYDTTDMTCAGTVLRLLGKRLAEGETVRDELNLYYVALTRAKYSLHMIFDECTEGTDIRYGHSFEEITDFSLWERYKMTGAGVEIPLLERQPLALDADPALVEKIKAAIAWRYGHTGCEDMPAKTSPTAVMKLADCHSPSERIAAYDDPNAEPAASLGAAKGDTDTEIGSAYHAFLERFDFSLLQAVKGNGEALRALVDGALGSLAADGTFPEAYLALLSADKLTEVLGNSVFYRLEDARLYREQRFMAALPASEVLGMLGEESGGCPSCDEEMLLQGAIDLLAVRPDGVEIIDYKYSQKGAASLAESYALQLRLYRMAVARALRIPQESIRCTLVNIYRGYELEID